MQIRLKDESKEKSKDGIGFLLILWHLRTHGKINASSTLAVFIITSNTFLHPDVFLERQILQGEWRKKSKKMTKN